MTLGGPLLCQYADHSNCARINHPVLDGACYLIGVQQQSQTAIIIAVNLGQTLRTAKLV
jgi:hypothetical protein